MIRPLVILCAIMGTAAPANADIYPVSGRWGESRETSKDPIDCARLRIIAFNGESRTDSKGGVPTYINRTVTPNGSSSWRIVDVFTTGQIRNGSMAYTLTRTDANRLEMRQDKGGTIKLQRCK